MHKSRFKWMAKGDGGDRKSPSFGVLIIGGGFCGAILAYHLMRRDPTQNIAIVDAGEVLGRGVAYSTPYWSHVLNVPAKNMSAFPDDAGHFVRWARRNFSRNVHEESFLPRAVYGRYIDSLLKEAATRSGRDLPWFRDQALTLKQTDGLYSVQLKSGRRLLANAVAIATGNVPPGDPSIPGLTDAATKYRPFSWSHTALDGLRDSTGVLLIGAGLTSVDLAIGLASTGFHGTIHMLSRRGLLPQPHRHAAAWPPFWNDRSPRTVRGLLRLIRRELRAAADTGADWRSVIDALRPVTPEIWQLLSEEERRRFMRHVRPYWDAHRHRVAPEISERLAYLVEQGRIRVHAGRITNYREEGDRAVVTYRRRQDGLAEEMNVDRVINCTGPEADWRRIDNSLLSSLFAQRLARPDPLFLGLDVDRDGSVRNDLGVASKSLFAIGPVRKGSVWETTAVPELRQQACSLAEHMLRVMNEELGADKLSTETLSR